MRRTLLLLPLLALACSDDGTPAASTSSTSTSTSTSTSGGDGDGDSASETTETTGPSTETSSTETTGPDTGMESDPACDMDAHQACRAEVIATNQMCLGECPEDPMSCAQDQCAWACRDTQFDGLLECAELYCPEHPFTDDDLAYDACIDVLLGCLGAPDCDLNQCRYDAWSCFDPFNNCPTGIHYDYAYAGACELELPGPFPFVEGCDLELALEPDPTRFEIGASVDECDSPEVGAYYPSPDLDSFVLCPAECTSFEELGAARYDCSDPDCALSP